MAGYNRLALEVIERHISVARELGASRRDLVPLLNALVFGPLGRLAQIQDSGLLDHVEITERSLGKVEAKGVLTIVELLPDEDGA